MFIVIELELLNSENNGNIHYLPHGVTTLSIAIRNTDDDISHRLLIVPTRISDPPCYVAYESEKGSKVTDSKDLKILWGGGMNNGYEVFLGPNSKDRIFYSLIHCSDDIVNYSFKIDVLDISDKKQRHTIAEKIINLIPPEGCEGTIKQEINYVDIYNRMLQFAGGKLPEYKSRWFGDNNFSFVKFNDLPIILEYKEYEGYIKGDIIIGIRRSERINLIGKLAGDLEKAKLHAELYDFGKDHYVLRIWCYWITEDFGKGLIGGVGDTGREDTELGYIKRNAIEVPDIERFDIIINKQSDKIIYVGTDLHWRETWWSMLGNHANLRFTSKNILPVLIKNLPQLLSEPPYPKGFDPAAKIMQDLREKYKPDPDPSLTIADDPARQDITTSPDLGPGFHRKHVPYVFNSGFLPRYRSHKLIDHM